MTETQNTSRRPGALIAMSGGVDSSVAAWLMQRDGFDCTGVTMRLTRNEAVNTEGLHTCCSERDIEDAAEVAYAMDIPYEVLDFTADFQEKIIDKFIRVYEAGGTPNPCIDCNKYMKFDHLLRWAEAHGLDHVVTGHYARVEQDEATGRWLLKKGLDENKDQSYVLYNLTQEQLAHVRLPLGGLHKSEVRAIAEQQHFVNARKHDSQDICFVPDGDYARFMEEFTGKHYPAGDFLDDVNTLASAVVALAGIALGIFVGKHRAHRGEHRRRDDVFARNQLDVPALAGQLPFHRRAHLRVAAGDKSDCVKHVLVHKTLSPFAHSWYTSYRISRDRRTCPGKSCPLV